mgnify:CR=1 FL=1
MSEITLVDLSAKDYRVNDTINESLTLTVQSTVFIGGRQVENLGNHTPSTSPRKHPVGMASGTDTIRLTLELPGTGQDDKVITVSCTFDSSADGIVHNDARPGLWPTRSFRNWTRGTRSAVLPQVLTMKAFQRLASKQTADDCSHVTAVSG